MNKIIILTISCFYFASCDINRVATENDLQVSVLKTEKIDGEDVQIYQLINKNGTTIHLTNYGAIVTKIFVADKDGIFENIVLGFDSVSQYRQNGYYFGATVGRYANRIAEGRFTLENEEYQLTLNNGPNHLHGGKNGFHEAIWSAESFENENGVGVRMTYISPDGDEGYPGELKTTTVFTLDNNDVFSIEYEANSDKSTIINLTHHGYFNLSAMTENILDHELTIYGNQYTPVNQLSIPTGEIVAVKDSPFDFTSAHKIGDRIDKVAGGYTLNYVIKGENTPNINKHAELYHVASGRILEVHSDAPGIQLYTGNFLDGVKGTDKIVYYKHYGVCLEPQSFPDSPNNPQFPTTYLSPEETYSRVIQFHFKTR